MKHTILPWRVTRGSHAYPLEITSESRTIAQIEHNNCEANAEFIVRACNSHYELLEACKRTVEMFDKNSIAMNELPYTYTRLKQVIAKAEGKND